MSGPDRHKHKPIRVRPRETDLLWLLEHSAATGRAVNAIVSDAVAAYRAGLSGPTASGPTTLASGPTAEKRKSQRAQAQEAPPPPPPPDVVEEAIVPIERSSRCPHPKARILKGKCWACGELVSKR